jgi:type I restriction enzyme S subunit
MISYKYFSEVGLIFPSLPEQQKIARFLTAIDTRIQTLEKKKSLLEKYKKGIIQKIFKQELRFKDENGVEFPKWKFVKLKEVLIRSTLKNTDEKIKFVLTNSATNGIVSQNEYFDKSIANQNNLQGYYVVEIDDFIYNPRISQTAPVGPLKRNKLAEGVMSPLYTVLRPKKGNLDFLEFYFETALWHKYMKSIANYGVRHDRMNITISDFENLPIPFPTLEEQKKIANFLSAIDKKITLLNQQIEHTKTYKKGLLQQMFV